MTALRETNRYQAYPEYKDSDVEWLDDIPKDWCTRRLKHMLESPMSYGANEAAERAVSTEPRYIRITDMNSDGTLKEDTFRSLPKDIASDYLLKDRDILLARSGATVGKSFIYRKEFGDCCFAGYLIKVSCDSARLNSDYAFWFFQSSSYWQYISGSQIQATIQNVSAEKYGEMYISLPEHVEEQTQIANFLDHETAKIDTLIEKQQQLIKLLKEKRQAVISHAVTKGLNPQAPMKNSGVEWLGEVPEHWEQIKLKHITHQIVDAEHKTAPYFDDGEYLVCRTTNVRDGKLRLDGGKYTNHAIYEEWTKRGQPEVGDILFTREAPAGEACVYTGEVPLCLGQRMVLFKLNQTRVLPEFVLHSIYSGLADDFVKQLSQGSTVAHFNMSDIQNIPLFEPPKDEQAQIVDHLAKVLAKYDALTSSASLKIELMQERRTALISAAVTGKIDVRNWQAPISQEQALEQTA
ncbi:hypothetical type I restriction-modification system specificity determinant [Vibrio alginolyticus 12G01]|uniref:restriction endonuclease subunit S n=1 Tax=Vibrio TaxID=662 RepID=UPI0000D5521D|nr:MULTISPECIES: restriction endonuclease subunit S [Vibrio]EAS76324.1 hypothetical type I restriction-modification system specificity determinant [Vibrio alginolyticus 12G01]MDW1965547.1 restriction endonuclease subunit S [Vibrio sp. Vb0587]